MDLRRAVDRIQSLVSAETGRRLGVTAEAALSKLLRNVASGNPHGEDGFAYRELTILFADLRGFMSISDRYPPEVVLQVLNRCLITMTEVVFAHEGTIDKFMGDSIMAHFGEAPSGKDPAERAVACAVDLQIAMDKLNAQQRHSAFPEVYLGIGINTGPVLVGTLGSELYEAHTVIGEEVALAARIEAFSLRGQVLLSESTFRRCNGHIKTGEPRMFVLVVNLRIKPDNVERFTKQVLENAREARKEPGCRQFDVLVDPQDKTKVMLYEIYNDEKAFEVHQQTPHFKKYLADAVPLLASRERHVYRRAEP